MVNSLASYSILTLLGVAQEDIYHHRHHHANTMARRSSTARSRSEVEAEAETNVKMKVFQKWSIVVQHRLMHKAHHGLSNAPAL